jgi:predicted P-loop ATPase
MMEDDEKVVSLRPRKPRKPRPPDSDWRSNWARSDSGTPVADLANAMIAMRACPELFDLVQWDQLAVAPRLMRQIPGSPRHDATIPRTVTDADVIGIQEYLQTLGLRRIANGTVSDAVTARANELPVHPVRQYLRKLVWDGRERLSTWLSYYLGCEPPEGASDEARAAHGRYIAQVGRMFMIGLVARVMRPGCKSDYMLVLEGPQGILKSTALRVIAGDEWFGDDMPSVGPHSDQIRTSMYLRGKWLIEVSELHSFSKADARQLKQFVTRQAENYVAKYGRRAVSEPRQCLFCGTTNEDTYLNDPTGGRRYWPVRTGTIDIESLRADRDQLLAEAVAAFDAGERWWPERDFEAAVIAPEQAERFSADPWQDLIEAWLSEHGGRLECTVTHVLRDALGLTPGQIGTREQRRATEVLRALRWVLVRTNSARIYRRPVTQ